MDDRVKESYLRLIQESDFRDNYSFSSPFTNVQHSLVGSLWEGEEQTLLISSNRKGLWNSLKAGKEKEGQGYPFITLLMVLEYEGYLAKCSYSISGDFRASC